MPRYHFDVEDGSLYPDQEGAVLDDLDAARSEALKRSVELLATHKAEFWRGDHWKMTVSNGARQVQFTLNFMAVNSPATQGYGRKPSED